jgi:nitrogen fixation NifU-like protein
VSDLSALYQEVILDHNRSPRNFHTMEDATGHAEGRNPVCGDHLAVWVRLDGDTVADVSFQGEGCAISKASASMMTAAVKGRSRSEAVELFTRFHDLVTGKLDAESDRKPLGRLVAFGGVSQFPIRVKCASLAWHAMHSALGDGPGVVTTERDVQAHD